MIIGRKAATLFVWLKLSRSDCTAICAIYPALWILLVSFARVNPCSARA